MKEVIAGENLKKIIIEAVDLISNAVSSTLGPSGNNVIINTDDATSYITNDGVTIAEAISSNDKIINTILDLVKEASLKTNDVAGDGTTTTMLLLQGILKYGLEKISFGKNPIVLKKEIIAAMDLVTNKLLTLKKTPSKKDYEAIASISAGDDSIGNFLANVFFKMKSKYAIRLEESKTLDTYYEIKKGYSIDIDNISNIYFQERAEINLSDVYVLILRGYLDNLEQISEVINEGIERCKNIIILVDDYNELVREELIVYYLEHKKNIYLFKIPDYASRKEDIVTDIAAISSAKIKNLDYENILWCDLGLIKRAIITKEELLFLTDYKDNNLLKELKKKLNNTNSDYEKEFLESRIAKLDKGIVTIYVGAPTKLELKEKMMRFEDAICALDVAKKGIVIGEGITYLQISNELSTSTDGLKVMKKVLEMPFVKIMENAGYEGKLKTQEIKNYNYQKVYNFKTNSYEDIDDTNIIDPVVVVVEALKNATSIATMLLTTNYLVINENLKHEKIEF